MKSAIKWVEHLDAELQPVACETLYQLIKPYHITCKTLLLMLMKCVTKSSVGIEEGMHAELEGECRGIIESIVDDIKQKDIPACPDFYKLDVLEFYLPNIVHKINVAATLKIFCF